jgi:hypothetical protein
VILFVAGAHIRHFDDGSLQFDEHENGAPDDAGKQETQRG